MSTTQNQSLILSRLLFFSVSLCVSSLLYAQAPTVTLIHDTVYKSDGSLASGSVVITWPPFISADNKPVFGGSKTIPLNNGALSVSLVPTSGATPSGVTYDVKYYQSGGVSYQETWVVPSSSGSVSLSQVRTVAAPSSNTVFNAAQVNGTAVVEFPAITQTIIPPASAGVVPLRLKGNPTANANVLEIYDSQATPVLQGRFDPSGALLLSKAPTFSTMTQGSLLFAGSSGVLSQENVNLFWDRTLHLLNVGPQTEFGANISSYLGYSSQFTVLNNGTTVYPLQGLIEDNTLGGVTALGGAVDTTNAAGSKGWSAGVEGDAYGSGAGEVRNLYGVNASLVTTAGQVDLGGAIGFNGPVVSGGSHGNLFGIGVSAGVPPTVSGGSVTNLYGLYLPSNIHSGGTLTNNYGIFVGDQSGVGTNSWSIKTGTGKVAFGDTVTAPNIESVRYADQFSSIKAAYDDLPATGGEVKVPAGARTETVPLVLTAGKPLTLECAGQDATNITWNTAGYWLVQNPTDVTDDVSIRNCTIQTGATATGAVLVGSTATNYSGANLRSFWNFRNVTFYGPGATVVGSIGLSLTELITATFDNVIIRNYEQPMIWDRSAESVFNKVRWWSYKFGPIFSIQAGSGTVGNGCDGSVIIGGAFLGPTTGSGNYNHTIDACLITTQGMEWEVQPSDGAAAGFQHITTNGAYYKDFGSYFSIGAGGVNPTNALVWDTGYLNPQYHGTILTVSQNAISAGTPSGTVAGDLAVCDSCSGQLWNLFFGVGSTKAIATGLDVSNSYEIAAPAFVYRTGGNQTLINASGANVDIGSVNGQGFQPTLTLKGAVSGGPTVSTDVTGSALSVSTTVNLPVLSATSLVQTDGSKNLISSNTLPSSTILPDGVTQEGHLLLSDIAAPASPAAAHLKVFGDSTDLRFHDKNAAGTIGTTVVADTGASHSFLTAISASGAISKAQPACGDLSDSSASCSIDATNASNISSGTLGAARLPNPSATTLGGIESLAAVSHQWINAVSTSGVPSATQPAVADLSDSKTGSGNLVLATSPTISTPNISGALGGNLDLGTNGQLLEVANDTSTGTTVKLVAKLSAGKAIKAATSDAKSYTLLGIVVAGAGTSGNAQIASAGTVTCTFDGAATQGNWAVLSTGTAGDCHDGGSSLATDGTLELGVIAATIGGAGDTTVYVFSPQALLTNTVSASTQTKITYNAMGQITSGAQAQFSDIGGSMAASQIPNPSASTLGGIESLAAVSNSWINAISTSGVPSATQPAFSNLSGSATCAQLPALTGHVTTSAGSCTTTAAGISTAFTAFCTGASITSSSTVFMPGFGGVLTTCTGLGTTRTSGMPVSAGTIKNLRVNMGTAGKANDKVTVEIAGVASALTCTYGTGTSCSDTTHTAAVTAGQVLTIAVVTGASDTTANLNVYFELVN